MSRFYPPSGGSGLPFDLYVVSAMVRNGSLLVSWSSGQPATEQIDYGIEDPNVPNQTQVPIDGQGQRIYTIMHTVYFPQTYVDTTHYFRVRSINRSGSELVSPVYSVYVTEKVTLASTIEGAVELDVQPVAISTMLAPVLAGFSSNHLVDATPIATADISVAPAGSIAAVTDGTLANQQTTFQTNVNTTVA